MLVKSSEECCTNYDIQEKPKRIKKNDDYSGVKDIIMVASVEYSN